ncbi:hypothetical protein KI387_008434, partial [Taxus chinensis]
DFPVLEEGYTVETVFDGYKMNIHPYTILPRENDIIVLDSLNSSFFKITLPPLPGSGIELFSGSGNGVPGFVDGDIKKAEFKHPKAFTSDAKGNIYVADRENFAIRKISKSGVSTIAGGKANKTGHVDGPSQTAMFSADFDLTFVPSICALLVSDRGIRMIRQIKLPPSECTQHSGLAGTHWIIPVIASLVSFFLGLLIMFFLYPYMMARAGSDFQYQKQTQKCSQMSMAKQVLMSCFVILSAIVRTCPYEASINFARSRKAMFYLMYSAVFVGRRTLQSKPQQSYLKSESLLDADIAPGKIPSEIKVFGNPSEDLINFDSNLEASIFGNFDPSEQKKVVDSTITKPIPKKLEELMHANISSFRSGVLLIERSNTRSMASERIVQDKF